MANTRSRRISATEWADLGRIAVIREQSRQRVDQAETPVRTGQQKHPAIGTDRAAVKCGGDLLLADIWQRERKQGIVIGGGHGKFCPELENGVSTQSLSVRPQTSRVIRVG